MPAIVPVLASIGGGSATAGGFIAGTTALGVGGTLMQAKAQRDAGKAQDKMAQINAVQQEQDAKDRLAEAVAQSRESRADGKRITSKQQSQYLKSGVLLEGSPLMVMAETVADIELESLEMERRGQREGDLLRRGAAITRYEGKQAKKAGKYGAAGTILQGVSSGYSQYRQLKYFSGT